MNRKWDEGFKTLNKAFVLISEGTDDFFNPPVGAQVTSKTTTVSSQDIIAIRLPSWKDRWKAAWRLLTRGEIILKKKKE
jgi:hypothetical protein